MDPIVDAGAGGADDAGNNVVADDAGNNSGGSGGSASASTGGGAGSGGSGTGSVVDALLADFQPGDVETPTGVDVLAHATPAVRGLVAQMRERLIAEQAERARVEAEARTRAESVKTEQAQLSKLVDPAFLASLKAAQEAAKNADQWTPEGQAAIQRAQVASLFEEMIAPVKAQLAQEAAKARIDSYVAANPDLKDPEVRIAVAKVLRAKPALDLSEAHALVRAERERAELIQLRQQTAQRQTQRQETAKRGGGGTGGGVGGMPDFPDAWSAYQWLQSNGKR